VEAPGVLRPSGPALIRLGAHARASLSSRLFECWCGRLYSYSSPQAKGSFHGSWAQILRGLPDTEDDYKVGTFGVRIRSEAASVASGLSDTKRGRVAVRRIVVTEFWNLLNGREQMPGPCQMRRSEQSCVEASFKSKLNPGKDSACCGQVRSETATGGVPGKRPRK